MNIENFNKLIQFLNNLEKEKFNLSTVVNKYDFINDCGTVCCAVGWFPNIFQNCSWKTYENHDFVDVELNYEEERERNNVRGFVNVAASLLEIPHLHASCLFSPYEESICISNNGNIDIGGKYCVDYNEAFEIRCKQADMKPLTLCGRDSSPKEFANLLKSYVEAYKEEMPIMS